MIKFFKDFLIYGIASVLGKIVGVLLLPIYTSILTREEYGAMAMLVSVQGLIDLFSNLNIHSGITRDYYEEGVDRKDLVSTGFWSILSLSLSIMIILLISKDFWLNTVLELPEYNYSFILLLLTIPAGSLSSYFAILTRFKKKPVLFSIGTISQLLIQISIAIYTIVYLRLGILGFFLATLISTIFSIIYFAVINREYIGLRFNKEHLKRALIFSVPTLPAILAGWGDSSLGQILIGKYVSLTDLGVYSIALQFASVFTLISVALNNVWSPFLYENYKKESFNKDVRKLFILFIYLLVVVASSISLLSKELTLLLTNESYLMAARYLVLLCIPMGVYLLFPIASSGVSISRDTKYIGISYVIGTIVNISILILFLPKYGVFIVPIGLGFSRLLTYMILYVVTKSKKLLVLPNRYILFYIFIVFGCYLVVYLDLKFIFRLLLLSTLIILLFIIANKQLLILEKLKKLVLKKS